jgi:excisionase family DNA binding protein
MITIMNPAAVALLLGCTERTVSEHAASGRLPGIKFGNNWIFPVDALLRAVNRLAETEAADRAAPVAPKAIRVTPEKKRFTRPNLSLL